MEKRFHSIMVHQFRNLLCGLLVLLAALQVSAAAPQCEQVFPLAQTLPNMEKVVGALVGLLAKPAEAKYFYEPNWDREQLQLLTNPVYEFDQVLQKSTAEPTYLGNKMSLMAGGVGFFHYNMFAEGNFRQQRVVGMNRAAKTADMAKTEIWFEWRPATQDYRKHQGGAVLPLLSPYLQADKHTVKLYRGLSAVEAKLFGRLKKGDASALDELLTAKKDALFFSPDPKIAKMWGEGRFIEMKFELSSLQNSYAGLEYNYVEVGIWQPEVLLQAAKSLKVTRP